MAYLDHGAFLKEVCAYHKAVSGIVAELDRSCVSKKVVYCTQTLEMETLQVAPFQRNHMQNWTQEKVGGAGKLQKCSEFELETGKSGAATVNVK